MSPTLFNPRVPRPVLLLWSGMLLCILALGQEPQPTTVTGVDLYKNPYGYVGKTVWLNPVPVPTVYNGQVLQYLQPSPDAMRNIVMLGYTGLSLNRALDSKRLLFDLREENEETRSSGLETYGQLVVVVKDQLQLPLQLDRVWVLKGLGSLNGTNGFGAPITVPSVEFLSYRGDERLPSRPLEPPQQTGPQQKLRGIPATTKTIAECLAVNTNSEFPGRVVTHEGTQNWTGLKFQRPICIDGSTLQEIQILDDGYGAVFQSLKNAPVKVTGTLVSGEGSPYYMTFYAIQAKCVQTSAGNIFVPKAPKKATIPKEIISYYARVSTVSNRNVIIKAAWSESTRQLEPISAYVTAYLNGGGDMAHIGCSEDFKISEVTSESLSSKEKQNAVKDNDLFIGIATCEELPKVPGSRDRICQLANRPVTVDFNCRRK